LIAAWVFEAVAAGAALVCVVAWWMCVACVADK
jgi:hypothetical protein